jgi:hypothetical protein
MHPTQFPATITLHLRSRSDFRNFYFNPAAISVQYKIVNENDVAEIFVLHPQPYNEPDWLPIAGTRYERVFRKKYLGGYSVHGADGSYRNEPHDGFLYCNDIIVGDISSPDLRILFEIDYGKGYRPETDGLYNLLVPTVAITDNGGLTSPKSGAHETFNS